MKPLIVANWKMNPSSSKEADILLNTIKSEAKVLPADIVICPPFIYLEKMQNPAFNFSLGAQNMFFEERGAFTGEISPLMLKSLNVTYVILGHSERRWIFGETDEAINRKLRSALRARLRPILCVGERSRDVAFATNFYEQEIQEQLINCLKEVSINRAADIVIAYEPVWAIGTNKAASSDDALSAMLYIRKVLTGLYDRKIAERIKILYGGSVDAKNAFDFVKGAKMDGLLVGGASLNASEFINIIRRVV